MDNYQTDITPREELYGRIYGFQKRLLANNISGALIVQNADLFYFSGTCQDAHLIIPAQGEPLLMVKRSYDRTLKESALDNISAVLSMGDIRKGITGILKGKCLLGLEMDVLPANMFFRYKDLLEPMEVVNVSEIIREIRMIKTPYEIERLKETASLSTDMFREVPNI